MDGRTRVGFIGTIREHKGVDDLVAAVGRLTGEQAPGLFLAGVDFEHTFSKAVLEQARQTLPEARLRVLGAFDGAELPGWVAATDVLCIPSRDIPGSWGQIPAKLFDAMAMAKPIVASNVNDMASILEDCGLVFAAGDTVALSEQLGRLATDRELGVRLGEAARARAIAQFSVESGRRAVRELILELTPFAHAR
jgi:glycosyltransferase involved in cell wall biosynthesis